jgi:ABC-2 type transport system permease protein
LLSLPSLLTHEAEESMRVYFELARRSFAQQFAYRGATLAGIFTNSIFGTMIASVFLGLFRSRAGEGEVAGWSAAETLTYVWVNQALLMPVYLWGWFEVTRSIQTGAIVSDLLKPLDFYTYWLSRDLGRAAAHLLIRGVPTFLIGAFLFRQMLLPGEASRWAAFLVSVVMAVMVSFAWRFIQNTAGFWIIDHRGVSYMAAMLVNFFSGLLLPLAFFPPWLEFVANVLPFRAILMVPNEVLLGQRSVLSGLALQLFWVVVMTAIARALLRVGERKVVIQGG